MFTCNRDEISSRDETGPGMKKILFACQFHPAIRQVEFHPGMKFSLKQNLLLSTKTYNKIYHFFFLVIEMITFLKRLRYIIGNFLVNAFSQMVLQNRVKYKLYFQRTNYTM